MFARGEAAGLGASKMPPAEPTAREIEHIADAADPTQRLAWSQRVAIADVTDLLVFAEAAEARSSSRSPASSRPSCGGAETNRRR